uniref:CSON014815 protein n=1 Tax=Culicoides sonorensis TaxID=179676 RepID=A0A336MBU8_CULSO
MLNVQNPAETTSEELILKTRGYRLLQKLGQGSYAKVYLGEFRVIKTSKEDSKVESPTVTKLACKVIDTKKAPPTFVNKFLPRELEILLKLNHPHIIHTHSLFRRKSKYYIFMRYAENGDLLAFIIRNGAVGENQSRIWMKQIGLALQYLHTLEIAHRDLKCENLLVTGNYNIKIADFGFSRFLLDENMLPVLSRTFCGSLQYAAPEIIKGTPYNPKVSDIWAMGVVLFTMLNKAMPFDDDNAKSLYNNQIKRKWRFRTKVVDKLSHECKSLVKKMLEPNTSDRISLEKILNSSWICMDLRLKTLHPDEYAALARAKDQIKQMKRGSYNITSIRSHHEIVKAQGTSTSSILVDMKKKTDNETYFIDSEFTPTSTTRLIVDRKRE